MLGYVYWQTKSVFTTIAIHGLRNFATTIGLLLGNVTAAQMHAIQIPFQLLWLVGQIGLMMIICRSLLGNRKQREGFV